ncbi:hypothetical protein [Pseudescherichia vulneris]|uniref:hypothetical protein n=1 Tax=Pseudescherichia vulneris TaxID=566 RepID=UPI003019D584
MNHPKSSMGSRRLVETSAVTWIDLLGYGAMLRQVGFDPTEELAQKALQRLNEFHDIINKHTKKASPTLILNDGAAIHRDLSPRANSVTFEFLYSSWILHNHIKQNELSKGYPGPRTVLATGFRYRKHGNIKHLIDGVGKHIVNRFKDGEISIEHAVYSALAIRSQVGLVPELQANFAFSKAYLAESSGSKNGFEGANFFVDLNVFTDKIPAWIDLDEPFKWEVDGMQAHFSKVNGISLAEAKYSNFHGIKDAFEIAEDLSNSEEIVKKLKALRT